VTDLVEQPGRFVIFVSRRRVNASIIAHCHNHHPYLKGVQESSTTLELDQFKSELVMLVDVRRDSDGKLRITRIKEFLDSVSMAKFSAALAKKFAAGPAA